MYNSYNQYPYQCPYCVNPPMYAPENMYEAYRTYPYGYNYVAPMYNPNLWRNVDDQYVPSYDENDPDLRIDEPQQMRDYGPQPYVVNIEQVTKQNNTFRTALWTGKHLQLTLMSIKVGEDIGLEVHPNTDQFIRIEQGQGIVRMGNRKDRLDFQQKFYDNYAIFIPAGKWHNIINTGNVPLKLYSIYAPPQHPHGTVHQTKAAAQRTD